MKKFFFSILKKNRNLLVGEAEQISGFMVLLMKQRNAGGKWTKEEKKRLKGYVKHLSLYVPVLIVFSLPGGSMFLPLLAEILDRRKHKRMKSDGLSGNGQSILFP